MIFSPFDPFAIPNLFSRMKFPVLAPDIGVPLAVPFVFLCPGSLDKLRILTIPARLLILGNVVDPDRGIPGILFHAGGARAAAGPLHFVTG